MRAKTAAREKARELRRQGSTYDEIVSRLGVSKSSVSLWVRDLPKPNPGPEHMRRMREARWGPYRRERDISRRRTKLAAAREIGRMTDRELFLVGIGLYWAEGCKSKPHRPRESVAFINSDPGMITVYLAWLDLLDVARSRLKYFVSIHESADVEGAEAYWADLVDAPPSAFGKTTLKRHNPRTVRKNTGESYRGCLKVYVADGADLYRRIEGWWYGIVVASAERESAREPTR